MPHEPHDPSEHEIWNLRSDCLSSSFRSWLDVRHVMSRNPITVSPQQTVLEAAEIMSENGVTCLLAMEDGEPVGILTETDFLTRIAGNSNHYDRSAVARIMSSPVLSVDAGRSVLEAGQIMVENHVKRLPVLDDQNGLTGVVTQTDVVRALTSYGMWRDVADIMASDVAVIDLKASVAEAAKLMTLRNISCVVAVSGDDVAGLVTKKDLLKRVVVPLRDSTQTTVEEVMSHPAISVLPSCSAFSASRMMDDLRVRRLVVLEEGRLRGIVAQTDVFRAVKKRLEKQEDQSQRLLDESENGIYTADLQGNVTYVNPALVQLLGVASAAELENRPFLPERFWLDPDESARFLSDLRNGGTQVRELTLKTAEGRRKHVTHFSAVTRNVRGEINGTQGVVCDVTDRKEIAALREAQEALRESEERYRLLAENAKDVIWTADLSLRWTYISPSIELLRGYTSEESMAQALDEFLAPDSAKLVQEALAEELALAREHGDAPNRVRTLELELLCKDGTSVWTDVKAAFLCDGNNEPVGVVGVARDSTERRRMEEELRESEKKFRTIFENATDVIAYVDKHGRILDVNDRGEQVFGYRPDEVIGKHFTELPILGATNPSTLVDLFTRTVRDGTVENLVELELAHKNGRRVFVEVGTRFIRKNGQVEKIVNIIRDISDRKRAMCELTKAKLAAESASRAKSEFLANVSHEIRTPLTAILGFADVLSHGLEPPESAQALETIRRNGQYLLRIINDILDLSKIEAHHLHVERMPCSPRRILEEVASLARVKTVSKGLSLELDYQGPIPATIVTDPLRLRQVLVNLVDNAVKFTETGSVRVVTRLIEAESDQPHLQFNVIDTGIGIPEHEIPNLFKPFTQGDPSTSRKFGGTGLGLSISERLVEMLGGTITVASTPGKGSTFAVTVPTGPLHAVPMLDRPGQEAAEARNGDREDAPCQPTLDCRVLLAEDGCDNQRLISLVLSSAGANVTLAENGLMAVHKALHGSADGPAARQPTEAPFDVILMDIQMPLMDGYEATRRLRQADFRGPIVALTAHATEQDRQDCLDAGCDDYLSKPVDRDQLLSAVARHVPRRQASS
ncbi:MAG: PAS domain S-box protein [Planctomycetota bacterium]|jgi:PAS domain S-box-containing protein